MLFSADAWAGIADGSITVTFRAWKRPQAKIGGRYRVAGMLIEVRDMGQVAVDTITAVDARHAGAVDLEALRSRLGTCDPVWRIDFVLVGADDRIALRTETSADDVADVIARLSRLDRNGAWTRTTLQLIERYPGIVSTAFGAPHRPRSSGVQGQRSQAQRARPDREPRHRVPPVAAWRGGARRALLTRPAP